MATTKNDKDSVSTDITPKGQGTTSAPGTDAAGNTTGNSGLTEDMFAESRAKEEAAAKTREEQAEAQKVPTEALTPEAREYTEAGEEAEEERQREWEEKVRTTETGEAPDQSDTGGSSRSRSEEARNKAKGEGLGSRPQANQDLPEGSSR